MKPPDFLSAEYINYPKGATAEVLTNKLTCLLEECGLHIEKMKSFVSDGASVMTGHRNCVAARLKRLNQLIINFHCICHKLALACADTDGQLKYMQEVQETLQHTWRFFENSPKRTVVFLKIQSELKKVELFGTQRGTQAVGKKIRKACKTRWLSLDKSVESALENYEALLHTFQELKADPLALGLYKKMAKVKFLGALYILKDALPMLSKLSKTGALNYSHPAKHQPHQS